MRFINITAPFNVNDLLDSGYYFIHTNQLPTSNFAAVGLPANYLTRAQNIGIGGAANDAIIKIEGGAGTGRNMYLRVRGSGNLAWSRTRFTGQWGSSDHPDNGWHPDPSVWEIPGISVVHNIVITGRDYIILTNIQNNKLERCLTLEDVYQSLGEGTHCATGQYQNIPIIGVLKGNNNNLSILTYSGKYSIETCDTLEDNTSIINPPPQP